jgi:hypothetical protein
MTRKRFERKSSKLHTKTVSLECFNNGNAGRCSVRGQTPQSSAQEGDEVRDEVSGTSLKSQELEESRDVVYELRYSGPR